MLFGNKYCGSAFSHSDASFQCLSRFALQSISADHPWSIRKRMICGDVSAIDGEPESSRTDVEKIGGIGQVHPGSRLLFVWLITRNTMMAAQCGNPLSRPTVPAPGKMTIPVENTGDEIITADTSQDPHSFY